MLLIDSERDKKYIQELKERVGESEIRLKFMSFKNDSHQAEEQKLTSEIVNFRGILYEH